MGCYCRMFYMPMSYLYGKRFVCDITPLISELREELLLEPYDQIHWKSYRHVCAQEDLYFPYPAIQDLLWDFLYICSEPFLTRWPLNKLREKALDTTMKHIHYEDENNRYITVGSFEKVLCILACWVEDPNGDYFKKHLPRIPDYLWVAEDGMKMQTFGSQMWDIGLAIQALIASDMTEEMADTLRKGHEFIKHSRVKKNLADDSLYEGRIVQVTVRRVLPQRAICFSDSGLMGVLAKEDYADDSEEIEDLNEKLHEGDNLKCKINYVQKDRFLVALTCKQSQMRIPPQNQQEMDPYYQEKHNIIPIEVKKSCKEKELSKKHFKPRMIVHSRF